MMTRSKTRACSNSRNQEEKPETIPFDLVIEILLRSPVKSIARFRSISKLWESTLATPNFTKSFFTISSSRPKLLFTCLKDNETFFFSSPSPCSQNRPPIDASFHMSFSINCVSNICRPVRGLVCGLNQRTSKGGTATMPLVCNPSTGQFLALPMVKTRRKGVISFFGYDPVDKHFKILCMTQSYVGPYTSQDHQVLTVEIGKKKRLSWRKIECDLPHYPASVEQYDGICINGVIFYLAYFSFMSFPDIACFDIRSEKFSCIKRADHGMDMNSGARFECALVNYKGKLAKLQPTYDHVTYTGVQLWVLEDAEKHQWSSHIYVMPPPWVNILAENKFRFVGTTPSGEIVLSPDTICDFFYLAYYKPEKNTISIVGIKGMEAVKGHRAYTFLDHEEDVKLFSSGSDHGFVT